MNAVGVGRAPPGFGAARVLRQAAHPKAKCPLSSPRGRAFLRNVLGAICGPSRRRNGRQATRPARRKRPPLFAKTGRTAWRRDLGLSLLEMLVVLVLAALLSTLLIQGLGLFLSGMESVQRHSGRAAVAVMRQRWFASTVGAMMPYLDQQRAFVGDPTAFEGLTLASLTEEPGLPRRIRWFIADDGSVRYAEVGATRDEGVEWTLLPATDAGLAFEYAGLDGGWRSEWRAMPNERQWIPSQVRLIGAGGQVLWLARLALHPVPVANFRVTR